MKKYTSTNRQSLNKLLNNARTGGGMYELGELVMILATEWGLGAAFADYPRG